MVFVDCSQHVIHVVAVHRSLVVMSDGREVLNDVPGHFDLTCFAGDFLGCSRYDQEGTFH